MLRVDGFFGTIIMALCEVQAQEPKFKTGLGLCAAMDKDHLAAAQLLFAAADATWRCEAANILERESNDPELVNLPAARGEPGSLLRTAYEVRERAERELDRAISAGCPLQTQSTFL